MPTVLLASWHVSFNCDADTFGSTNLLSNASRFSILNTIIVREPKDLEELANSEARIMLLYSTK